MLRGKLVLPDFKVSFESMKYEDNKEIEEKVVNTLVAMAMTSCEIAGGDEKKAMDIFTDLVSALYKLPMFISHAPVTEGKYLPTAFEYFLVYTVARHVKEISVNKDTSLEKVFEELESFEHITTLRKLVRDYFFTVKDIYEALLETPADTRPGFNFTSLASHVQLTSLLSWLLQPQSVDLNYLRLASLLHDIGKLIKPKEHVTASIEIMKEVMKRLEGSCIKLDRVTQLISAHHSDVESIVQKADHLAASADRLSSIVKEALDEVPFGNEYSQCFDKDSYECVNNLGKEKYETLSKELYKYILSEVLPESVIRKEEAKMFPFMPNESRGKKDQIKLNNPKGYIVYIDLPSIQKFIFNFPKLKEMSFASFLVDFLVTVYAFMILDNEFYKRTNGKSRLPAEALLSGYGGHSYIVIRSDFCKNDCVKEIKDVFKGLKPIEELDVKLSVYVSEFADDNHVLNYHEVWDKIKSQFYERYVVDFKEEVYSIGLHRVCDNCGVRPAVAKDEERYLCSRCREVSDLSRNRGFISKVTSTYYVVDKITPKNSAEDFSQNYQEYAMEFIAGYKSEEDSNYVALIKADGNWGSVIFTASATFSDYVDKSFRLDYGVKRAFYETLVELVKAEKELGIRQDSKDSLVSRILAGVLYLGGDDISLLVPSIIAVPFAVRLFEKAKEYTGFTFKVGIVSVKPDHPIQFAFQAADELMERSKIKAPHNETSIGCIVFSSTLASRSVIDTEIGKYEHYLVVSNEIGKVKELLQLVNLYDFKEVVRLYNSEKAWEESREKLRLLEDIVGYADTSKQYFDTLAYIFREIAKSGNYEREVLKKLVNSDDPLKRIPLYDYYFILKTFRVGVGARSSSS